MLALRPHRLVVSVLAAVSVAVPAIAHWTAGGTGVAVAFAGTLGAGNQPSAGSSGNTVTLTWTQTQFRGAPLGGHPGGGYKVLRYPAAGGAGVAPTGTCGGLVSGSSSELTCSEEVDQPGAYRYSVTPVLNSWTGLVSPRSGEAPVAPEAPVQNAVTPVDPGTGQSVGALQLSWPEVPGATGYNVYRRTSAGAYDHASPLNSTPLTDAGFTDPGSGLSAGVTYHYVVRAVAGTVESLSSNERSASPVVRPAAPTGIAAVRGPARITVSWNAVTGASGYNLYRRTATGSYGATPVNGATPITAATFDDTGMTSGTAYRYKVRAVGPGAAGGQLESLDSSETASVTYDGTAPGGTLTDPGSPKRGTFNLAVTAVADSHSGPPALTIQRSPAGAANWTAICTPVVVAGTTSYSCPFDSTTVSDGSYDFRSVVVDGAGNQTISTRPARRIDNTPPVLGFTDPGPYVTVGEALSASATDVAVTSVAFQRSDPGANTWTNLCTPDTSAPYTCTPSSPAGGTHDLRALATDAAGNTTTSPVFSGVTFDLVRPTGTTAFSAVNALGLLGRGDTGDVVTYAFSEPITPASVLAGWNGAAMTVRARFTNSTTTGLDRLNIQTTTGGAVNLGQILTYGNFVATTVDFNSSTMVMSGNTVVVTLGGGLGTSLVLQPANMSWSPSSAIRDAAGNAPTTTARVEVDGDLDF